MAYGAYLTLDQSKWAYGDFSDTNKLTGTIYSDKDKTAALSLTGYTLTVRFYKSNWNNSDYLNKEATIVSAANGTWSYAPATGEMPGVGRYKVKIELSKSGERMSTLNDQYIMIRGGPTA